MHNFRVYWISLYMLRTVFPSIIRSSRLYTKHHVYVILKLKMGKITVEFMYKQSSKMLNKMGNSQLTWYVHIEFYFNFFYFIGRIYCIFWMYFNILSFNLYSQNFTYNASHISLLRIYTLLILPILFYILLICIY